MRNMVDIEVVLDEAFADPRVTISTKQRTKQVENIIDAIERASENDYPVIPAYSGDKLELLSQRDIVRVYTQGRRVMLRTEKDFYYSGKTLASIEELLNSERFLRISQSEIINLYKVKSFEFSMMGTIGIEFDNGDRSWAARSRVTAVKEVLKEYNYG